MPPHSMESTPPAQQFLPPTMSSSMSPEMAMTLWSLMHSRQFHPSILTTPTTPSPIHHPLLATGTSQDISRPQARMGNGMFLHTERLLSQVSSGQGEGSTNTSGGGEEESDEDLARARKKRRCAPKKRPLCDTSAQNLSTEQRAVRNKLQVSGY